MAVAGRRNAAAALPEWIPPQLTQLVDAALDFFKLAPEHFRMGRIFARGRGRPNCESHFPPSRSRQWRAGAAASWFIVPSAAGFVNQCVVADVSAAGMRSPADLSL
jgi:hypothetical protein